jgi:hypothetical protein
MFLGSGRYFFHQRVVFSEGALLDSFLMKPNQGISAQRVGCIISKR